ncbi:MalY/PatB family protein [Aureivirga sp. CE67]|uniref:MalY/PatB family protein n=1 Tax=Aureivirga sp. CE67 TaxID=1788983 RepID=UPI0018C98A29|nr:PatB family C-S lyase [Aureivirga sp. CE67]
MNKIEIFEDSFESNFVKKNPEVLKQHFGISDIDSFWIADMDYKIAKPITEELLKVVHRENYGYEDVSKKVNQAISDWYLKKQNIHLKTDNFIRVNNLLTAISILVKELTEENEEIIIQTPVYPPFTGIITSHNRKVLRSPLKIENQRYKIDFEDLEKKMSKREVRYFLFCNPHNPIGSVWDKEDVEKIYFLAEKYDVIVISDEIHSDIIFNEKPFTSFTSFENSKHITLVGSPSKTFGLQGISSGFIYIPDVEIRENIKNFTEKYFLHHENSLTMYATIAAFTKGEEWLNFLLEFVQENFSWIQTFLHKELPQIKVFELEGTYQIWLNFSELNLDLESLEELVFRKAKIGLTPGKWFGEEYHNYMRMNIACSSEKIQKAFNKLKKEIKKSMN